jgi:hypothetical protein
MAGDASFGLMVRGAGVRGPVRSITDASSGGSASGTSAPRAAGDSRISSIGPNVSGSDGVTCGQGSWRLRIRGRIMPGRDAGNDGARASAARPSSTPGAAPAAAGGRLRTLRSTR